MKKSKIISFIASLLITSMVFAQNNTEKTLVKSFNLQGSQLVMLDMDADYEIRPWANTYMQVQMTVGLENGSEAMLKSLIQARRYNLDSANLEGDLKVFAPGLARTVSVGGKELLENFSLVIYVPSEVEVKPFMEATTEVETKKLVSSMK